MEGIVPERIYVSHAGMIENTIPIYNQDSSVFEYTVVYRGG